ncbi:MAG: hypothetical protein ACR2MY_14400 [Candidatus Dormibacteria bacterium]
MPPVLVPISDEDWQDAIAILAEMLVPVLPRVGDFATPESIEARQIRPATDVAPADGVWRLGRCDQPPSESETEPC